MQMWITMGQVLEDSIQTQVNPFPLDGVFC